MFCKIPAVWSIAVIAMLCPLPSQAQSIPTGATLPASTESLDLWGEIPVLISTGSVYELLVQLPRDGSLDGTSSAAVQAEDPAAELASSAQFDAGRQSARE
jgi:hypothetical protein